MYSINLEESIDTYIDTTAAVCDLKMRVELQKDLYQRGCDKCGCDKEHKKY